MFTTAPSQLSMTHAGDGPLVVLCHGVTDSAASLCDLSRRLEPHYRVVALDSLGHGLSRRFTVAELATPMESALAALEDAVEALTQEFGPAVILGHSMGGALATRLAARRPELLAGVIAEDPAWLSRAQDAAYKAALPAVLADNEDLRRDPATALATNRTDYPSWPDDERAGWLAGKLQVDRDFLATGEVGYLDWLEWVGELAVPTLVISGDGVDVVLGPAGLAAVDALGNPRISTALIPGARHCVRREDPQAFAEAIEPFLARVQPRLDPARAIRRPGDEPQPGTHPGQTESFFIEPELRADLDEPYFPQWDPIGTRERARLTLTEPPAVEGVELTVTEIGGIEARVWAPDEPTSIVVSIHGGGFVAGSARGDDDRNADMARRLGAAVVSPDYRLAPEHPFPAGALDCAAVAEWASSEWKLPLFVYGDSAGGGLAESVTVMLLEGGLRVDGLIMIEPFLDPSMSGRSIRTHARAQKWNRDKAYHAWRAYLAGAHPRTLPRLVHIEGDKPRVLTVVASADLLRDEGIAWTTALVDAGFDAALHMPAGTYHAGLTTIGTRTRERVMDLVKNFVG